MPNPIYRLKNFTFNYPFSSRQIQLSGEVCINSGDLVLINGASGSGKSTLLLALKGIIPHLLHGQISGEVEYRGTPISRCHERDLMSIGYLQQNPTSQLICPDVYSELAFGLENQALDPEAIAKKIKQLTLKLNISHLLNRNCLSLSGGEKQKVCLASILLMQPQVLLLDEPTAFLDPISAQEIIEILNDYAAQMTIIIIEHNLNYLRSLVNRVLTILDNGEIIEQNPAAVIWHNYLPRLNTPAPAQKSATPLLQINNLTYQPPQSPQQLLTALNLSVTAGEIIALQGASGSGKSTLLQLICGLIKPNSGTITLAGQALASISRQQIWQMISLVWQNPEAHFLANTALAEVNDDIKVLKQFQLAELSRHNPFNLSEGQKRRLSLAIAHCQSAKLLLLDEPTFGQDYANKLKIAELIRQLADNGCTIIIVSHDHDFMQAVAHKIYQLTQGQLHEITFA